MIKFELRRRAFVLFSTVALAVLGASTITAQQIDLNLGRTSNEYRGVENYGELKGGNGWLFELIYFDNTKSSLYNHVIVGVSTESIELNLTSNTEKQINIEGILRTKSIYLNYLPLQYNLGSHIKLHTGLQYRWAFASSATGGMGVVEEGNNIKTSLAGNEKEYFNMQNIGALIGIRLEYRVSPEVAFVGSLDFVKGFTQVLRDTPTLELTKDSYNLKFGLSYTVSNERHKEKKQPSKFW